MSLNQLTTEISEIEREITDKTNLLGKIDAAIAGKMATRQSIEVSINQLNEKLTAKRNQKKRPADRKVLPVGCSESLALQNRSPPQRQKPIKR